MPKVHTPTAERPSLAQRARQRSLSWFVALWFVPRCGIPSFGGLRHLLV